MGPRAHFSSLGLDGLSMLAMDTSARMRVSRWVVVALAACFAMAGCQSTAMRGQDPTPDFAPAPDELPVPGDMPSPEAMPVPEGLPAPKESSAAGQPVPKPTASKAARPTANRTNVRAESHALAGQPPMCGAPSELRRTSLPTYVVEPPDILLIDAIKLVPKPPYLIEALDVLQIVVVGTLLGQDIAGQFVVDPSGMVDLGPSYGKVYVMGQSIADATTTIDKHLRRVLRQPEVSVTLSQSAGQQQVAGEHLIGPDGTINLGTYGIVYVAGMTLMEVKDAVEAQLGKYLQDPRVSVDVFAYNSKVYYIISQGAGLGDSVTKVPITGNETVLDAIAQVNGTSRFTNKKMWIARPTPNCTCDTILPINWNDITAGANASTNYQILPGDRVFMAEDKFVAFNNDISKWTGPFERLFGFSLLGAQTVQTFNRFPLGQQGGGNF